MTISSGELSYSQWVGNGVADTFDYDFTISAETDLLVTITDTDGVDAVKVLSTDYTVTGVGDTGGGSITLVAGALTDQYLILIEDNVPTAQEVPFGNQSSFNATLHETAFDKVTRIARKVAGLLDFSLTLPSSVQGVSTELPKPTADTILGWNGTATAIENKAVVQDGVVGDLSITTAKLAAEAVTAAKIDADSLYGLIYPAQVANHIRAGNTQILSGDASGGQLAFQVNSSVTTATWESIGPTGSGADNIWTALDVLPAKATILLVDAFLTGTTTADGQIQLYAVHGDEAMPVENGLDNQIGEWGPGTLAASTTPVSTLRLQIPLGATNQDFHLYWTGNFDTSENIQFRYRGFITDPAA